MIVASFLQPLENVVLWLLHRFHDNLGLTWAWAIVATTITVRIVLVPLTVRQIHSMQAMQKHAPEMKEIQKKYKGDRAKLNEELMKFYKENHINPAASCLPLVAQLPVFFSLYLVLKHFTKHVPAGSDLSWLHIVPSITAKASAHWSGYLLLAIYASSQVLSTYFMSAQMDKMQRRLMMVVPLIFITVIASFPVGLVIYWVTTNLWTVGQGVVTRRLVPKTAMPSFGSRKKPAQSGGSSGNGAKKETPPPKLAPAAKARPAQPAQPRRVKRSKGGPRR
ncbi:MAG TPA: YidC/Oxa1 family membrane protein insertase [Gaiellaceae bacterium]|nr:YidC/Oxa1 family membrane protein insertase [Gaiellaceae bacterium]